MRRLREWFVLSSVFLVGVSALGVAVVAAASRAKEPETMSLLQTLALWQYPGSKLLGGASMSDGGYARIESVRCRANLTTPDPFAKVAAFYAETFAPAAADAKEAEAKSVATQEDSEDRPVAVRVFVADTSDTDTTVVVSRAEGETQTHISWIHYRRFPVKEAAADR